MEKLDVTEALRYLGAGKDTDGEMREWVEETAQTLMSSIQPRWTWKAFNLKREQDTFLFCPPGERNAALSLSGRSVETMLGSCQSAVLLSCTLGAEFETMLRGVEARSMAECVILDACGSAWVEAGCSTAEREIAKRFPGLYLTDRFSPGYGDFSLTYQRDICTLLDTPRRLGVHVTDSFLLNPSKSVTAVIGISDRPQMARIRGCAFCSMRKSCVLRKIGHRCAGGMDEQYN